MLSTHLVSKLEKNIISVKYVNRQYLRGDWFGSELFVFKHYTLFFWKLILDAAYGFGIRARYRALTRQTRLHLPKLGPVCLHRLHWSMQAALNRIAIKQKWRVSGLCSNNITLLRRVRPVGDPRRRCRFAIFRPCSVTVNKSIVRSITNLQTKKRKTRRINNRTRQRAVKPILVFLKKRIRGYRKARPLGVFFDRPKWIFLLKSPNFALKRHNWFSVWDRVNSFFYRQRIQHGARRRHKRRTTAVSVQSTRFIKKRAGLHSRFRKLKPWVRRLFYLRLYFNLPNVYAKDFGYRSSRKLISFLNPHRHIRSASGLELRSTALISFFELRLINLVLRLGFWFSCSFIKHLIRGGQFLLNGFPVCSVNNPLRVWDVVSFTTQSRALVYVLLRSYYKFYYIKRKRVRRSPRRFFRKYIWNGRYSFVRQTERAYVRNIKKRDDFVRTSAYLDYVQPTRLSVRVAPGINRLNISGKVHRRYTLSWITWLPPHHYKLRTRLYSKVPFFFKRRKLPFHRRVFITLLRSQNRKRKLPHFNRYCRPKLAFLLGIPSYIELSLRLMTTVLFCAPQFKDVTSPVSVKLFDNRRRI